MRVLHHATRCLVAIPLTAAMLAGGSLAMLVSAAPRMKVWAKTVLCWRPNTSLLPGCSVVCTPTGVGKLRGSTTVSLIAVSWKNLSCVPHSGRSPFRVFWL